MFNANVSRAVPRPQPSRPPPSTSLPRPAIKAPNLKRKSLSPPANSGRHNALLTSSETYTSPKHAVIGHEPEKSVDGS